MKSFLLYSWTITLILLLIIYEACEKFYALLQTITAKINIRQMHHIRKSPKLVSVNKRYLKVISLHEQNNIVDEILNLTKVSVQVIILEQNNIN